MANKFIYNNNIKKSRRFFVVEKFKRQKPHTSQFFGPEGKKALGKGQGPLQEPYSLVTCLTRMDVGMYDS